MAQLQSEFIILKTEGALEITLFKAVTVTAPPPLLPPPQQLGNLYEISYFSA